MTTIKTTLSRQKSNNELKQKAKYDVCEILYL